MMQNITCSLFCSQLIASWLSPAGNIQWITMSVKLVPIFITVANFHPGRHPCWCIYNIITNKWALLLNHTFTCIYLLYIGIVGFQHIIGCCYHDIGCCQNPNIIMSVLCPTISFNISLYQDIWCFTYDFMCASRFLTICDRFTQSESLFRYSTRARYLPPAGYMLQYPVLTSRPRETCPSNNIPNF